MSFCDLQDKSGRIQLYARKDEMDAEDYEILVRLYRGQLFGLITEWMMQGMQSDILQNFHRVCALRSGMTEELIRRANLRP